MLLQYSSLKNYAAVLYYQLPASGAFSTTIITFLTQRSGTLMFPNFERPFLLFSFLIFRRLEPMDSLILHVEFTFLRPIFRSLGSQDPLSDLSDAARPTVVSSFTALFWTCLQTFYSFSTYSTHIYWIHPHPGLSVNK